MKARSILVALVGVLGLFGFSACGGHNPPQYDSLPILVNRDEITAAMAAVGAGLKARVILLINVDDRGHVRNVRVGQSSGSGDLDDAAVWIGQQMRFEPARSEGNAVAALVRVPVSFDVVSHVVRPARLRNAEALAAVMARDYPDVAGTVRFRVRVGPEGWVQEAQARRPGDDQALKAAHELLEGLEFWPAYEAGKGVASWVTVAFHFAGEGSRIYIESTES